MIEFQNFPKLGFSIMGLFKLHLGIHLGLRLGFTFDKIGYLDGVLLQILKVIDGQLIAKEILSEFHSCSASGFTSLNPSCITLRAQ